MYAVPRITYFISSKVFIDINIPLCITNSSFQSEKTDNPQLPVKQRRVTTFNFETLPKIYSARIGVGLKL